MSECSFCFASGVVVPERRKYAQQQAFSVLTTCGTARVQLQETFPYRYDEQGTDRQAIHQAPLTRTWMMHVFVKRSGFVCVCVGGCVCVCVCV